MEEKWFCTNCGQENDGQFCIKCGSPKPQMFTASEEAAAPANAEETAAPANAANAPAAGAKKKKTWLIIVIAAVVVAAILAVLFLFVFNVRKKNYENEIGNYSITVPAGYKVTDYDNGLVAQKKDAALFVDYVESAPPGDALVYDWYDLMRYEFADRMGLKLKDALGITELEDEILDVESFGDADNHSYSISALCEDGSPAMGELYIYDSESLGCYVVCYYMKNDISEKKAEKNAADFKAFLESFNIHGAPNIPEYEIVDLSEMYLGELAVRSELVGDTEVGSRHGRIISPDGNDHIYIEIIFANSVLEVFSWEGITDGQIESSTSEKITDQGRYDYDVFRADYRDKDNNKRAYGIYGSFADNNDPAIIAIEYDVSADNAEWAEEVCHDIIWSWYMY